ncbi:MAG: IreB family regulatory phosphoprotein [Clostridia bacterium]|nr:IreB family regulatory phosphoprotein [Oscillospiraceae bacterium]MBQ7960097.1 IreB family regulatory phosphoprotein [Clostridia bacterium]
MDRTNLSNTVKLRIEKDKPDARELILSVHGALTEKGYNPISQIVGYIMSGDPSYITAHKGARTLIQKLETDEILEELVRFYVSDENK